jgi:hypothetical protein
MNYGLICKVHRCAHEKSQTNANQTMVLDTFHSNVHVAVRNCNQRRRSEDMEWFMHTSSTCYQHGLNNKYCEHK